jgi:hypothetical protein
VSEFVTKNPGILTERAERDPMSSEAEASILIRRVAEPRPVGDTVKTAIVRAASRVSRYMRQPMAPGRAEDIWRREARAIRVEEMDAIRKAAAVDQESVREAKHVLADIDARIARLEALLVSDADFYRDQVDAHRAAMGDVDRTVDRVVPSALERGQGE